jgi:hypothetical protein
MHRKILCLFINTRALKGQKSVSNKHIGGCLRLSIWAANIFKNFLIVRLIVRIFKRFVPSMWKSFYLSPRTADYIDTRCGAQLFDRSAVCPRPILVMCGLPSGGYNLTSGCHGNIIPANFSFPVCSSTGEASKNAETSFMLCFSELPLYRRKPWVAKVKISIYIVKANFF